MVFRQSKVSIVRITDHLLTRNLSLEDNLHEQLQHIKNADIKLDRYFYSSLLHSTLLLIIVFTEAICRPFFFGDAKIWHVDEFMSLSYIL